MIRCTEFVICLAFVAFSAGAQGIPEPGVVYYGRILDAEGGLVTSGRLEGEIAPVAGTVGHQSFSQELEVIASTEASFNYVLVLRSQSDLGSADFSLAPDALVLGNQYELRNLRVVAGGGDESPLSFLEASQESLSLSTTDRGLLIRMDLTSGKPPEPDDYWAWAAQYWPDARNNPDADPDADPDGDGLTNEHELGNSDPTGIYLSIQSFDANSVQLEWDGADTVTFTVQRSADLSAPNLGFQDIGEAQGGAYDDTDLDSTMNYFYRVKIKEAP